MDCRQVENFLQENFLATGFDVPDEISKHLDDCSKCRVYYEDLISLEEKLNPWADISMTPEETAEFEIGLHEAIEVGESYPPTYVPEGRIYSIARMALAAAAVLIIMATSLNQEFPSGITVLQGVEELQLSDVDAEDMALIFNNGDSDLIPSLVEDESAAYLTSQVRPGQAEDILEGATAEELDWLLDNLTMEI